MSWSAIRYVFTLPIKPSGAKNVAFALAYHVNYRTLLAWPSQETLADKCTLKERQVRAHLAELESDGVIRRHARRDAKGQRGSDVYEFVGLREWLEANPDEALADLAMEATGSALPLDDEALAINRQSGVNQPAVHRPTNRQRSAKPTGSALPGNQSYRTPHKNQSSKPVKAARDARESDEDFKKRVAEAEATLARAEEQVAIRGGLLMPVHVENIADDKTMPDEIRARAKAILKPRRE